MRCIAFCVAALIAAGSAIAQTEDDLVRWVQENKPRADAGQISQLEFHREMHRRISIIPAETYPFKLQNLRWIGQRIDVLEALEAGKLTPEQAERALAQTDAEQETADVERRRAQERQKAARAEQQHLEQQRAAAREDEARRALALQLLQNRMANPPPTLQIAPLPMPPTRPATVCNTERYGNTSQTICR